MNGTSPEAHQELIIAILFVEIALLLVEDEEEGTPEHTQAVENLNAATEHLLYTMREVERLCGSIENGNLKEQLEPIALPDMALSVGVSFCLAV
jgi:hypothetical protein